jgi:AmmeMemoRadiSam system protein B/AmmeMemoRadiSam system protein A
MPVAGRVRRVVLLGPAHRVALRGLALPVAENFETPLGSVALDDEVAARLLALPQVTRNAATHAAEHSLEVQLPFLQKVLGDFALVPLVVGDATAAEVAEVLEEAWGGDETLIVISSDLSHYLPYDEARAVDAASIEQLLALGPELTHAQACGATPLNGAMRVAARKGLVPHLLDLRNSGDTAGDRGRVVGYAAVAFEQRSGAGSERGDILLAHARHAIESLYSAPAAPRDAAFLDELGATFVTLRRHGELRGCIGSLEAERRLRDDVAHNARAAALRDPRFAPLTQSELDGLAIEVSLLSEPVLLVFADEDDLTQQLAAQRSGVILQYRNLRSTFLPQVWDELPDARSFLRQLKTKAGLAADFWTAELRVAHYEVEKWTEQ